MGKTKGFIEPKGSRRRVRVRVCRVFDSIEPEAQRAEGEGFEFARPGGEYGFSSLMKQNKKGKKCAVFCFAGKRKILFVYL